MHGLKILRIVSKIASPRDRQITNQGSRDIFSSNIIIEMPKGK